MYIILGGNGHIGSVLAETLLSQGEAVTIISRHASSQDKWHKLGAKVAVADVNDTPALKKIFKQGKRLFLLNPPAEPATDTDTEERKRLSSIFSAIEDASLEKIVAQSTYGAQSGENIGDLGTLYEMEERLNRQVIPFSIIRAAYYMSNWDMSLQSAQQENTVYTFFPANFLLPMVAPQDIGRFAARLMTEPAESTGTHHFEGPARYTSQDVAQAFSSALQKPVTVTGIPPEQWKATMQEIGFSNKAAESFANMTKLTLQEDFTNQATICGDTPLNNYISALVKAA